MNCATQASLHSCCHMADMSAFAQGDPYGYSDCTALRAVSLLLSLESPSARYHRASGDFACGRAHLEQQDLSRPVRDFVKLLPRYGYKPACYRRTPRSLRASAISARLSAPAYLTAARIGCRPKANCLAALDCEARPTDPACCRFA